MQDCDEEVRNSTEDCAPIKSEDSFLAESEKKFLTDHKKAAKELNFFEAVNKSANGFAVLGLDGTWIHLNPALTKIVGYSKEELLGMNFQSITHPDDLEWNLRLISELLNGKRDSFKIEKRYKHKNGYYVWIQMEVSLISQNKGTSGYLISQIQEITERKAAETALKESEARFRQLAETIDEVFWMKEAKTNQLLYVSPAYERIWGLTLSSLYENPDSWLQSIHPDDLHLVMCAIDRQKEQVDFNERFRIQHSDGSERWIRIQSFQIFDSLGKLDRIVGVARDVTKQHELEKQLAHSQRMESIGSLAGGVAHDFNNILTVIMGFASLLDQNPNDPQKVKQSVQIIQRASERGASLIKQLLTLARKTESYFKSVSFNDLIREAVKIARATFPKSILITTYLEKNPIYIHADYTQIHQIFVNLIINAKDAMIEGGELSISLKEVSGESIVFPEKEKRNSRYALLEIEDTGIGMDEETKRKIFDPFFTTKEVGKGTGLGLALVYGIVENHKGLIQVESVFGKGTIFRVYLPIEERAATGNFSSQDVPEIPKQKNDQTILLVEDEPMIREPLTNYLSRIGYKVLAAKDGEEALSVFFQNRDRIQIVLCDLNLPKINGLEVLKKIRAADSSLFLVLASGYIDPQCKSEMDLLGLNSVIQKPYDFKTILKILQEFQFKN
ncbi:hybrid sensor histidine kinase/response regulator [Leptospira tipperaryensis]|uniref:histidine kinase n=1 Tax=Leptospira tipperaryensis TaxID=2564040 RepID=A0A1D7UW10_9LEPT|nr:PAS domain S-box protein [Leptospira tipperaryensis]AOP33789.1 hybrid sensor histidine kinase/response regulator [Leptospira tipperaryensis]